MTERIKYWELAEHEYRSERVRAAWRAANGTPRRARRGRPRTSAPHLVERPARDERR